MININQLIKEVFKPAVKALGFDEGREKDAVALLLYTCSQESKNGEYIKQMGNGPAMGIMQVEPATYNDIIDNYIYYRKSISASILKLCQYDKMPTAKALTHNLVLSACFARVLYRRSPMPLPAWDDLNGMWAIYKKYYNTNLGKATKEEFLHNANLVIDYLK